MRSVRAFARLPPADRVLLLEAAVMLLGAWLALRLVGFRRLRTLGRALRLPSSASAVPLERLEWAVGAASRIVPGTTCLTEALALARLAARRGYCCDLHIGVRGDAGFRAHAWVEHAGRALLDRPGEAARYTRLLHWSPSPSSRSR